MSETLTLPAEKLPDVRGKLTQHAPLAKLVWFKAGGKAGGSGSHSGSLKQARPLAQSRKTRKIP